MSDRYKRYLEKGDRYINEKSAKKYHLDEESSDEEAVKHYI